MASVVLMTDDGDIPPKYCKAVGTAAEVTDVTLWEDQLRSWNHVMRDDFFFGRQQANSPVLLSSLYTVSIDSATLVIHLTRRNRRLMILIARLSL